MTTWLAATHAQLATFALLEFNILHCWTIKLLVSVLKESCAEKDIPKQPIAMTTITILWKDRLSAKNVLLDSNALIRMEHSILSSVREATIALHT